MVAYRVNMLPGKEGLRCSCGLLHVQTHPVLQEIYKPPNICIVTNLQHVKAMVSLLGDS